MPGPGLHTGEAHVFDSIWAGTDLFYNDGDVRTCRNVQELFENVKFRRLDGFLPEPPCRSLEVGCGSAGVSLYLHNRRGYDVTLVDLSEEALALARRNFATHAPTGSGRVSFQRADALHLPFTDGAFDVVMSFGLLEHFTHIDPPIVEQLRVLRPGGTFFADVVTRRFSVDALGRMPGQVVRTAGALLRGDLDRLRSARSADFYENSFGLAEYVSTVQRHGGLVRYALGNRPFPTIGRWPLVGPMILGLYKTPVAQRGWSAFDYSGSRFARWWGAGWWIVATKS